MDRRDHLGALADRPADPLDRAGAHVADREHAGHGGFQRRQAGRRSRQRAPVTTKPALSTSTPQPLQPVGRRIGADEQEDVADRRLGLLAGRAVAPAHPLEAAARRRRRARRSRSRSSVRCSASRRCARSDSATCSRRGPAPRTIMRTFAAWPDRNTAPWPAELPPPTRMTSSPAHSRASIGDAQYQTPRPSKRAMSAIAGRR